MHSRLVASSSSSSTYNKKEKRGNCRAHSARSVPVAFPYGITVRFSGERLARLVIGESTCAVAPVPVHRVEGEVGWRGAPSSPPTWKLGLPPHRTSSRIAQKSSDGPEEEGETARQGERKGSRERRGRVGRTSRLGAVMVPSPFTQRPRQLPFRSMQFPRGPRRPCPRPSPFSAVERPVRLPYREKGAWRLAGRHLRCAVRAAATYVPGPGRRRACVRGWFCRARLQCDASPCVRAGRRAVMS